MKALLGALLFVLCLLCVLVYVSISACQDYHVLCPNCEQDLVVRGAPCD